MLDDNNNNQATTSVSLHGRIMSTNDANRSKIEKIETQPENTHLLRAEQYHFSQVQLASCWTGFDSTKQVNLLITFTVELATIKK